MLGKQIKLQKITNTERATQQPVTKISVSQVSSPHNKLPSLSSGILQAYPFLSTGRVWEFTFMDPKGILSSLIIVSQTVSQESSENIC